MHIVQICAIALITSAAIICVVLITLLSWRLKGFQYDTLIDPMAPVRLGVVRPWSHEFSAAGGMVKLVLIDIVINIIYEIIMVIFVIIMLREVINWEVL